MYPIKTRWLMLRMWLGWDPKARAARRRLAELHAAMEKEHIRQKALAFEVKRQLGLVASGVIAERGDRVLLSPAHFDRAEGEIVMTGAAPSDGDTIFDMPSRAAPVEKSLTAITEDGIEVQIYDPTDEATAELMRRYEMGDATEHERQATLMSVDTTPPPVIEWEGEEPDPFAGIKNLG